MMRLFHRFCDKLPVRDAETRARHRRRATSFLRSQRQLSVESLERRALLSVSPQLPLASLDLEAAVLAAPSTIQVTNLDTGSIAGKVYHDDNRNGVQDGEDQDWQTWNDGDVSLYLDANNNGVFDSGEITTQLQTDSNNPNYSFTGLAAGDYIVRLLSPSTQVITGPAAGYVSVSLADGQSSTGNNIGLASAPPTAISGKFWHDDNRNGVQDGEEADWAPWNDGEITVYLDANDNGAKDAGETSILLDGFGSNYTFNNLSAGTHIVRAVPPGSQTVIAPAAGYYSVTLTTGQTSSGNNFGLNTAATYSISGTVWHDDNANGVRDAGEQDWTDWDDGRVTLYLDANNNGVLDGGEVTTGSGDWDGNYSFGGLSAGTYTVRMVTPNGKMITAPSEGYYSVTVGGSATGKNFGLAAAPPTAITGKVWHDDNRNGVWDGGEAEWASWNDGDLTLYLDANNNGVFDAGETSTQTGAFDGNYSFSNLAAGTYIVRMVPYGTQVVYGPSAGYYSITLSAGQTSSNNHFGLGSQSATINGTVWYDDNGNGVWDFDESEWYGWERGTVTAYIDANNNGSFDEGERTSETGEYSGAYSFSGLVAGTYTVRLQTPGGKLMSAPAAGYYSVTLATNQTSTGNNFGLVNSTGSISGYAWHDDNYNGIKDAGEADWTDWDDGALTVYLDADNDGVLDPGETTTQTGGFDGNYSFGSLAAGTYTVRIVTPGNKAITTPSAGYYTVNLGLGQSSTGNRFGLATPITSTISGWVWHDDNGNGVQDGEEQEWKSWNDGDLTLYLDANDNGVLDAGETTTNTGFNDGNYSFTGLGAGSYIVRMVVPSGKSLSIPAAGYYSVTLTLGQTSSGNDFGVAPPATPHGSISGEVWHDDNRNGVWDGGEAEWASWNDGDLTLYLDANNNGVFDAGETSTQTGAFDGNYSFNNLTAGTYIVRMVPYGTQVIYGPSAGYYSITLSTDQTSTGNNFGLGSQSATINGTVWYDDNANGVWDFDESEWYGWERGTVTAYIDANNNGSFDEGEQTSETGEYSGAYSFNGLVAGTYTVRLQTPGGKAMTAPAAGYYSVTLATNQTSSNNNFGLVSSNGSISGYAWHDDNFNGIKDAGESDWIGWDEGEITVYLDADNDGVLDAGETSTTTGTFDGSYSFGSLAAGTYTVRIVTPGGKMITTPSEGYYTINLGLGQSSTGNRFGLATPITSTISGWVWHDDNGNGAQDGEEQAWAAWNDGDLTLYLDANDNGALDGGETTTLVGNDGNYSFTGLGAGSYIVRMVVPSGKSLSIPAAGYYSVTLTLGQTSSGNDFGVAPGVSPVTTISGQVFADTNGNGVCDPLDEAYTNGVTVYLDANNNGVLDGGETSTVTASGEFIDGYYEFTGLTNGQTYIVREVAPSGKVVGTPAAGYYSITLGVDTNTGRDFGNVDAPAVAPKVTAVYVRGSSWNAAFLNGLATAGLGDATLGYKVSIGTDQLKSLPWTNINTINVVFDSDVTIAADDASLVGVNTALYTTNFSYNSTTHVATWTKSSGSFTKDKLLLHISGSAGGVTAGGALLDGEWTTSSSTLSGNGTAGGDFNFRLNVVPGDANRGLTTTSADVIQVRNAQGTTPAGGGLYTYYKDLNGSASITSADVIQARNNQGNSLPAGEPVAPSGMSAFAAALDELFSSEEEEDWLDMI